MQGLNNLGSTCAINSFIQLIYRCDKLKTVILNSDTPEGTITYELKDLFKVLDSSNNSVHPARFIHNFYNIFKDIFRRFEQNDICEIYLFIIQKIHDEISEIINYNPEYKNIFEEHAYKIAKHNEFKKSPVLDLLQGSYLHSIECLECGHINRNFEPFIYIALDVNDDNTIHELLNTQFSNETRGKDEWLCDKCNKNCSYNKKTIVWKSPEILFISLNRFQKNNKYITTNIKLNFQKDYLLNGIGFHHGSLEGGHYNAININKELKKFIMYDDNVVNEISNDIIENVLKSSNSYLIVYV